MDLRKENVYNYLKEQIITCKMKPGDVIDLRALMEVLKVSRTPIRDALSALEQENLVTILPRRGVLVTEITPRDISNIYYTRTLVEPDIARVATSIIKEEELLGYRDMFFHGEEDNLTAAWNDYSFHKTLVDCINNPYMSSMMDMILSHNMRFVVMAASLPNRLNYSNTEHLAIIDAMLSRDPEAAEKAMRDHIAEARRSSIQSMEFSTASYFG